MNIYFNITDSGVSTIRCLTTSPGELSRAGRLVAEAAPSISRFQEAVKDLSLAIQQADKALR